MYKLKDKYEDYTAWEKSHYTILHYFSKDELEMLGKFFESLDKVFYFNSEFYYDVKKNKWPQAGSSVTTVNSLYFVNQWMLSHWDLMDLSAEKIIDKYCRYFDIEPPKEVLQQSYLF